LGYNRPSSLRFAIVSGTGAFFTAVFFSFFSEIVLPKIQILMLSFLFLLAIIFIGIIFDVIGVACAVADESPFHAKAAKKLKGSSHAILLIRHADKVASFCNDVVGDICGTVSGALGAAIAIQIVLKRPSINESILSIIMTGLVASLTVGGKALGKRTAMYDSERIVFRVGQALAWFDAITGMHLLSGKKQKNCSKRR
jgi:CBS domain containing-hemolysin-like protein